MIGTTISHYKILEKLGEGGMGVVYKAQDLKLNRFVALKFLPQHITVNEAERSRFMQEAQAAAALNHPNICTIHAIEEADGQQFIVMEYVEGLTLREKLPVQKIQDVLTFSIQIADALQEAHSKGIVHRDIKADNIMIDTKGQVRVMDFGLAKLRGTLKLTRSSSTVGTLGYMAPEQIQGGEVDHRSDVFSFGVLLFEMLSGKLPFRGEHEAAMVYSIVNENPESIEKYRQDVSPELTHLISRSLEKDSSDRYQAMSEIAGELKHLKKQTSKVYRTERLTVPSAENSSVRLDSSPVESPKSHVEVRFSRKNILLGGGALLVLIVALGLYLFLRPREAAAPLNAMKIARLTSIGKAVDAVISPEGRFLVYVMREKGKSSLWLRQIASMSNVQIMPPTEDAISGLTLSRDGNYLYYLVAASGGSAASLYKMPTLGGSSRKLLDDLSSPICLSPDEKQFTFTRIYQKSGEFSLMIANEDGSGERVLATHKADKWFTGKPAWSPDGNLIVCALGNWEGGFHHEAVGVSVKNGSEKEMHSQRWYVITQIEWLRDGSGLVLNAIESGSSIQQLWFLSQPDGSLRRVTNDLNNYQNVSLTEDTKNLCIVQSDFKSNLWLLPGADANRATQISSGKDEGNGGMDFTLDGRLVYASSSGNNSDIWITNSSGTEQKQLTSEPSNDVTPAVSRDGQTIFFGSDRSGIPNIWKIAIDGSKPQQLTKGGEDYNPAPSPDGKWLYFDSWDAGPLLVMKIPLGGGEPQTVIGKGSSSTPKPSPDGKLLAFVLREESDQRPKIVVTKVEGGEVVNTFDLPKTARIGSFQWMADGKSISFIDTREDVSNIWAKGVSGGLSRKLTDFKSDLIFNSCWSRDGKHLAVARGQVTSDVILMSNFR